MCREAHKIDHLVSDRAIRRGQNTYVHSSSSIVTEPQRFTMRIITEEAEQARRSPVGSRPPGNSNNTTYTQPQRLYIQEKYQIQTQINFYFQNTRLVRKIIHLFKQHSWK